MTNFTMPLFAIHVSGSTQRFDTPHEAAKFAAAFALKHKTPALEHVNGDGFDYLRPSTLNFISAEWILRDALGQMVKPSDLPQPARKISPRRAKMLAIQKQKARAVELKTAIPLGDLSLAKIYGLYRSKQRIWSEIRANQDLLSEIKDLCIAARKLNRLRDIRPSHYNDGERRHKQRNWKQQRRTQWKSAA